MNDNGKSTESAAPSPAAIQHTKIATGLKAIRAFEHELGYLDPKTIENSARTEGRVDQGRARH